MHCNYAAAAEPISLTKVGLHAQAVPLAGVFVRTGFAVSDTNAKQIVSILAFLT